MASDVVLHGKGEENKYLCCTHVNTNTYELANDSCEESWMVGPRPLDSSQPQSHHRKDKYLIRSKRVSGAVTRIFCAINKGFSTQSVNLSRPSKRDKSSSETPVVRF